MTVFVTATGEQLLSAEDEGSGLLLGFQRGSLLSVYCSATRYTICYCTDMLIWTVTVHTQNTVHRKEQNIP